MILRYVQAVFLAMPLILAAFANSASAVRAEERHHAIEDAVQLALTEICTTYIHSTWPDQEFPQFPGLFEEIGRRYGLATANDVSEEFSRNALPGSNEETKLYTLPTSEGKLLIMVYDHPVPYLCNLYVFGVDGERISSFVHSHLEADEVPYKLVKQSNNPSRGGSIFRWYEFLAGTIRYSILTEQWLGDYRSAKDTDYTFMAYISHGRDVNRRMWVP